MKREELEKILDLHDKWRRGEEGGVRAHLGGANLVEANLAGAYLARAYLARANLAGAHLGGANLGGANLAGAYLAGAHLGGARGIVILTETDHGYRVIAAKRDDAWRIYAGCRDFTLAEARAHWGADDYRFPLTGRRIIACLDWLEREIAGGFTL